MLDVQRSQLQMSQVLVAGVVEVGPHHRDDGGHEGDRAADRLLAKQGADERALAGLRVGEPVRPAYDVHGFLFGVLVGG